MCEKGIAVLEQKKFTGEMFAVNKKPYEITRQQIAYVHDLIIKDYVAKGSDNQALEGLAFLFSQIHCDMLYYNTEITNISFDFSPE